MHNNLEQIRNKLTQLLQDEDNLDEFAYLQSLLKKYADTKKDMNISDYSKVLDEKDALIITLSTELYRLRRSNKVQVEVLILLIDLLNLFMDELFMFLLGDTSEVH